MPLHLFTYYAKDLTLSRRFLPDFVQVYFSTSRPSSTRFHKLYNLCSFVNYLVYFVEPTTVLFADLFRSS